MRELSKAKRLLTVPKILKKTGPKGRSVLELALNWRALMESNDVQGRKALAKRLKVPSRRVTSVLDVLAVPAKLRAAIDLTEGSGYTVTESVWEDLRRMRTDDAIDHLRRLRERKLHG